MVYISEAKLNRYEERMKAALEFIASNKTLVKLYEEHLRDYAALMVRNDFCFSILSLSVGQSHFQV